jgi:hypothetical protein
MTPLDNAISYAHRGLAVFPVRPRTKTPLVEHGHHDATTARPVIERWWQRWPDAGVGIACQPSRLMVVDVDPRNGGDDSLADLERQHGALPKTWRALTGGGGLHAIFAAPSDTPLRDGPLIQGIDLKANGYIVAPPSLHASGRRYIWEVGAEPDEISLAPPPRWLLERLPGNRTSGVARPPDEWAALIHGPIATGERNDTIARLTGYLLRRRPAPRVVLELVRAVNLARCTPPLSDEEVLRTVDSIAHREAERAQQC